MDNQAVIRTSINSLTRYANGSNTRSRSTRKHHSVKLSYRLDRREDDVVTLANISDQRVEIDSEARSALNYIETGTSLIPR